VFNSEALKDRSLGKLSMKEYAPVRHVVEKYKDSILDQDKIIEAANDLWGLVDALKQDEKFSLPIFQNMVCLLHKILTLHTKPEIQAQLGLPAPQAEKISPYLEKLHDLVQTRDYWMMLSEIQSAFSTQCVKEAMEWMTVANKKVMLLQYNKENTSVNRAEVDKFKESASKKYQQVNEFCLKYRIDGNIR